MKNLAGRGTVSGVAGVHGPIRGVSVDAAGTLLHPRVPPWQTYQEAAARYGVVDGAEQIRDKLERAMSELRPLRVEDGGWRAYWRAVIVRSTGCSAPALFDDLYTLFARAESWDVAPGATDSLESLRRAGIGTVLTSNWDVRLEGLLDELGLRARFDAIVVSGAQGLEKPDPEMFRRAAAGLGLGVDDIVHVGNDADDDVLGARRAGCRAWHFGTLVQSFPELVERICLVNGR